MRKPPANATIDPRRHAWAHILQSDVLFAQKNRSVVFLTVQATPRCYIPWTFVNAAEFLQVERPISSGGSVKIDVNDYARYFLEFQQMARLVLQELLQLKIGALSSYKSLVVDYDRNSFHPCLPRFGHPS